MTNHLYNMLIAPHAGNKATFLDCDDGTSLSYDAFVARVGQIAHVLTDAGVAPGDRVAVQAPKLPDTIALYAACLQTGAIYLPLNTAYTQAEMSYFIGDAAPAMIVCDARDETAIGDIAGTSGAVILTLSGAHGSLTKAANAKPTTFQTLARSRDDPAALLYTSGTTGRPKGAMLSHRNLGSNALVLTELWRMTAADRLIHALPIFHTHGLFVAMNTALLSGARVRFMTAFSIDTILKELPNSTLFMGVPTFYRRLLADDRLTADGAGGMRLFISGSAPLLAETHIAFQARTGHCVLERYGMTETNTVTSNPDDGTRIAGTVGFALPGIEVQVTNTTTGAPLPPGKVGMIEVRGDNVFLGYWNMPEKTARDLRPTGFFITGDLGVLAPDGRLSIIGRAKDLIISGGYSIFPREIEAVLNNIAGVSESAVFGVPHPDFGESVLAAVVANDTVALDAEALRSIVEPQFARFKHPRRYIIIEKLPRNVMGNVQRNVLRDAYSG